MRNTFTPRLFAVAIALIAATSFVVVGAFADDESAPAAPTAAPAAGAGSSAEMPTTLATKTPSPMHSTMAWIANEVLGDVESPCPSCPDAANAWRGWFEGGAEVPLAGLRDQLVADGWNADRYIQFFVDMAKSAESRCGGDCGDCDGDCGDCEGRDGNCCGSCPGASAGAAPTGDATGPSSDAGSGTCPGGCDCDGDCDGCPNKGGRSCGGECPSGANPQTPGEGSP